MVYEKRTTSRHQETSHLQWAKHSKSVFDNKTYDCMSLPNGLQVFLVSSPEDEESVAVLQVDAGSFDEPDAFPGLAHYLEHVLFLGTEKYPKRDEYSNFIHTHGGTDNAMTEDYHTTFYFRISSDFFEEGLERLSQFFIAPLFSKEYLDKERHAVDAEYKEHQASDAHAILSVNAATSAKNHPFHRFSIGNLSTLKDQPHQSLEDAVKTFYQSHYSPEKMTLTLVSPHPIKALQNFAKKYFSALPQRPTKTRIETTLPYGDNEKNKWIEIKPHGEFEALILEFPVTHFQHHPKDRPIDYLNHVLNDTSPGSLADVLNRRGWAIDCSFNPVERSKLQTSLSFSLTLTPDGYQHIDNVMALIFRFIEFHRQNPISKAHYQEIIDIDTRTFVYTENAKPLELALQITQNSNEYPVEHTLNGNYLTPGSSVPEKKIQALFEHINPDNMRATIISPKVSTDQMEPYYQIPYRYTNIPKERLKRWRTLEQNVEFTLPSTNPFVPSDFTLHPVALPKEEPDLIDLSPRNRLWYLPHNQFGLPKTEMRCQLIPPPGRHTLKDELVRLCYELILSIELQPYESDWLNAGIGVHISHDFHQLSLNVSGFSHRLHLAIETLQRHLNLPHLDKNRFEDTKTLLKQAFVNNQTEPPYQQLIQLQKIVSNQEAWTQEEKLAALDHICLSDVRAYQTFLLEQSKLEWLIVGNTQLLDAIKIAKDFAKQMPQCRSAYNHEKSLPTVHALPKQTKTLIHSFSHLDHALVRTYPVQQPSIRDLAILSVISAFASPLFYDHLRTDAQLGYSVGCYADIKRQHAGLTFFVNSPHTDSYQIHKNINHFVRHILPKAIK